jgi:hypothetical protein
MPQDNQTGNDSSEANKQEDSIPHVTVRAKSFGLRWIIIGGCIATVALLLLSVFLPNLTERVKFFTVNFLSLLVLVIIAVQAYIYKRQWEAMQESLSQNERAVRASETQAIASQSSAKAAERMIEITQQAYIASERAYIGIREITMGSFSVGQIPTLNVTWYNGGKTPASRFRAIPYLVFGDKPEKRGYLIDDDWSDSTSDFLPSGVPQTIPYPQAETGFKVVTEEMLAELNGRSKALYAIVTALYLDFTGQERSFDAEYIFDMVEGKFVEI